MTTDKRPGVGRRILKTVGGLAALGLLVVGGTYAYVAATGRPQMFTVSTAPAKPVALVLGAQVYPDGTPSPYLKGRLDRAHELYRAGKVKAILVSGDNGEEHYNEPDAMRNYLIRAGVPATKVVADYAGFDTYDSCVRADKIFGVKSLIVVTQGYHAPRAVTTCRLVGVDAVAVGDYSANVYGGTWRYGQVREVGANMKMLWDVATRRTPILGQRETSIDAALKEG